MRYTNRRILYSLHIHAHQRKLLFLKKTRTCDNSIVRSSSILSTYEYGKIMSKYSIHNPGSDAAELESSLWRHFVDTAF